MDTEGFDDSLSLRRSARRVVIQSKEEYEAHQLSPHSSPSDQERYQLSRKRRLSSGERSEGVSYERVGKRVKEEGEGEEGAFPQRKGRTLKRKKFGRRRVRLAPPTAYLRQEEEEPLRRSKREKRLTFASFNISAMHRQLENPAHDFPHISDSSEDDMEPYEKLLSPRRVPNRSARLKQSNLSSQSSKPAAAAAAAAAAESKASDTAEGVATASEKEDSGRTEGEGTGEGGGEGGGEEVVEDSGGGESEEEEEEEFEEEEEEEEFGGYHLRKRRPVIYQYQPVFQVVDEDPAPKQRRQQANGGRGRSLFHSKARSAAPRAYQPVKTHSHSIPGRRKQTHHDSSSTSSGSDTDEAMFRRRKTRSMQKARAECLPMNFSQDDISSTVARDRIRIGASLADIDPMNIDRSVTFSSIGGLQSHIKALKEMIIFPLLYPEVFDRFKIQPPRGVLFHGPPGCGKTLLARALANECSQGGQKVAFFMRKGADCLSKWVGESERQLRLLFDQAYQMRPSIIFFDEIDGLAPVRSSRQDQIHSSIVSTLLALMDGLDNRGEMVVIGATNRIDAIDPALRRPGRFDREFLVPLPKREDRAIILSIHTRLWVPPLKPSFLSELAEHTVGYCGADLRALCTEAALFALRRRFPQIYQTSDKLVLDVSKISVSAGDFQNALKAIVPTTQRSDAPPSSSLQPHTRCLLLPAFKSLLSLLSLVFPPAWSTISKALRDVESMLGAEQRAFDGITTRLAGLRSATGVEVSLGDGDVFTSGQSEGEKGCVASSGGQANGNFSGSVLGSKVSQTKDTSLTVQRMRNKHRNRTSSASNSRTAASVSYSVSSWEGAGNTQQKQTSFKDKFSQLCVSSRLEDVYFDTASAFVEQEDDSLPSNSILVLENEAGFPGKNCDNPDSMPSTQSPNRTPSSQAPPPKQSHDHLPFLSSSSSSSSSSTPHHPHHPPTVHRPRVILCGGRGMGQSGHLGPALLHALEELPVRTLDLSVLCGSANRTAEEACTQVFREARRNAPSVLYLPLVASWWGVAADTVRATFLSCLLSLPPSSPVLLLATAECPWTELHHTLRDVFCELRGEVFSVAPPSLRQRCLFFHSVLLHKPSFPLPSRPRTHTESELEPLPVASPPKPRELTNQELEKMDKQREAVLRELRVFLRDATNKLLAERKFKEFVKPVDPEDVPDYYDIILQAMDLSTIMKSIDEHRYTTPHQWMSDVDIVTRNALEYNPENDSESRLLRHRAIALQDMAHSFLDHELSEDFEKQCEEIHFTYEQLGRNPTSIPPVRRRPLLPSSGAAGLSSHSPPHPYSAHSSTASQQRRSLRQMGRRPEDGGLPYYSPPKPRTPRKSNASLDGESDRGDREQNGDHSGDKERKVVQNCEMELNDNSGDGFEFEDDETRSSVKETESITSNVEDKASATGKNSQPINLTFNRRLFTAHTATPEHSKRERACSNPAAASSVEAMEEEASAPVRTKLNSCESTSSAAPDTDAQARIVVANGNAESSTHQSAESMQTSGCCELKVEVELDGPRLAALFERVCEKTSDSPLEQLDSLRATFEQLVFRHRMSANRNQLLKDLELATELFLQ